MLYQAFLLFFYCYLLVILFVKQIENDRCDAILGKIPGSEQGGSQGKDYKVEVESKITLASDHF